MSPLDVRHEDNHLLVVNKPAGTLVQGDQTRDPSLVDLAKLYRKKMESKPGNVYIGLVHRLDRPVSGIVLLAKTSKCARRLTEQFKNHRVDKTYFAVVENTGSSFCRSSDWVEFEDVLWKDQAANRVEILALEDQRGKTARTRCRVVRSAQSLSLLELHPLTGRAHQLRVQLAHRGFPIVGDRKYGGRRWRTGQIALHAYSLTFEHPTRCETMTVACSVPGTWSDFPFRLPKG